MLTPFARVIHSILNWHMTLVLLAMYEPPLDAEIVSMPLR